MLGTLMLSVPLPYIANTEGGMTEELGRQPWLIHGLMRTAQGISPRVAAGNAWFTLIGFMGLYTVVGILWLFLFYREIELGPEPGAHPRDEDAAVLAPGCGGDGNRLVLPRCVPAPRVRAAGWFRS